MSFMLIPLNTFLVNKVKKMRRAKYEFQDTRIKMMNEILAGIRVKIYIVNPYTIGSMVFNSKRKKIQPHRVVALKGFKIGGLNLIRKKIEITENRG